MTFLKTVRPVKTIQKTFHDARIVKGSSFPVLLLSIIAFLLVSSSFRVLNAEDEKKEDDPNAFRYSFKKDHDPNGIGKFYMGREIAHVMGYLGADWLERPQREKEEKLSLMVRSLKIKPGMVIADIGAGSGVISLLAAEKTGPDGKVIAVDVQDEMLNLIRKKIRKLGIENIEPKKGSSKSPNLKKNSVDLIFMVDVYHEFEFPFEMLQELSDSLKPGGRIAFVEYRMEDPEVPIKLVHKMSQKQVKKEAEQPEFHLEWVETIDVLPRQHIIVFRKKES